MPVDPLVEPHDAARRRRMMTDHAEARDCCIVADAAAIDRLLLPDRADRNEKFDLEATAPDALVIVRGPARTGVSTAVTTRARAITKVVQAL